MAIENATRLRVSASPSKTVRTASITPVMAFDVTDATNSPMRTQIDMVLFYKIPSLLKTARMKRSRKNNYLYALITGL
jgi:hypothetical protein